MDQLFKQKLLGLRKAPAPTTFAQALYPGLDFSKSSKELTPKAAVVADHFTEKEQVLNSLEQFAQEKIEVSADKKLSVDGGEIVLKSGPSWEEIQIPESFERVLELCSLEKSTANLSLKNKRHGEVKVLFVAESFRTWNEIESELKEGNINELLPAFPLKTAEFFARMITAMKLTSNEIMLYPSEQNGNDIAAEVMAVAGFLKPEIIITLGATASHRILKVQDRLNMIHGQFFQRQTGPSEILTIVPLYHPTILETNHNMKKTAWTDMQKIMVHLKKAP